MYEVRDRGGTVVRNIPVDKHMSELTLSLSGDKDDEEILDITLKDPHGGCHPSVNNETERFFLW